MDFYEELKRRSVLRVATAYALSAWVALQGIDVVFPILGIDESLGRPILVILLIGFPVALLLAWTLEITPAGIKRDTDVDHEAGEGGYGRRRLDRIIVVVLTLALGLLLVERFAVLPSGEVAEPVAIRSEASLAVLPFANLSGNREDEYFSDGLTETLLHMLAQSPQLKVAARTSSFSFKGMNVDIREIAESLGVDNILEGSVQRAGNQLRITVQLIEARHGFHLWSKTYDRGVDDIFSVQDEIATSVSWALQMTLLTNDGGRSAELSGLTGTSAEAYETFLQGLEQKNLASYGSLPHAESLFKKALALDPDFADAKLELAFTYELQSETGLISPQESERRIRPLVDQVLEAQPENGRALGLLATIDFRNAAANSGPASPAAATAEKALMRALEFAPSDPGIYTALSNVYAARNEPETALAWTDKGLELDPLSARLHLQRGRILLFTLDRAEEALEAFEAGRELAPGWTAVVFSAGQAEFRLGNFGDGVDWYLRAMEIDPQDHELPSAIARFYYQLGMTEEGDDMFERARAIAPDSDWIRSLELEREIRAGNYERAALIAERMLNDGVGNRGSAYEIAVMAYASAMVELGRADRVPEFFETLTPGVGKPGFVPADFRQMMLRFALILALSSDGPDETTDAMLGNLGTTADAVTPGWRDNNSLLMTIAIAHGDRDAAITSALADLAQPLAENLNWDLQYRHLAWVRPLLEDERVASRVSELDAELFTAREDVRRMLASR
jgi:TolB-like protein/tetratricopeptide (TPR) repeat protein